MKQKKKDNSMLKAFLVFIPLAVLFSAGVYYMFPFVKFWWENRIPEAKSFVKVFPGVVALYSFFIFWVEEKIK